MEIPSAKTLLSAAASAAATVVVIRSITKEIVPPEIHDFLRKKLFSLFYSSSSQITITIEEFEGLQPNQLFSAADLYLGTKICPTTQRFRAAIPAKETHIILSMDNNQKVFDVYDGVQFKWRKTARQTKAGNYNEGRGRSAMNTEVSCFELSFHKKHRDTALKLYLPHIVSQFFQIKEENKTLKIHMLRHESRKPWVSLKLDHPATFETLAMDPDTKQMIMDDLDMFVRRKDFYRRVGKAWKRGYLLFGPPGTGKSSLIAAISNYLKFDIYDLELANLGYGFDPRKLLVATENKSILVVEDIDCSFDLENRKNQVRGAMDAQIQPMKEKGGSQISLSSLLNFIDGLWSSCGDERIIIFTTNHKERLDPVLLRPGRMDVHIHMSYCTPFGFRKLASSYLGISEHPLFMEVEELMAMAKATPAEVGEQLMKSEDSETALRGLLKFLKVKMEGMDLELKGTTLEKEGKKNEATETEEMRLDQDL